MVDTLFTPKNLKHDDVWLVRIGRTNHHIIVKIGIYKYNLYDKTINVWCFGEECEYSPNEFEFIRKIEIPELENDV